MKLKSILGTMLCILFSTAKGRILRSNCGDNADFSHIQNGMALQGNLLETFIGLLPKQCEEECINHINCKSINVEESGERRCELNRKSAADPSDRVSLIARNGWTFKGTDYSDPRIGRFCKEIDPCGGGFLCMDVCYSPGYKCHLCRELSSGMPCRQGPEYANVAKGKQAKKSDVIYADRVATLAMDSNIASCSMLYYQGWWRVDLGGAAEILSVTVYGTTNANYDSYHRNLMLKIGNIDSLVDSTSMIFGPFSLTGSSRRQIITINPSRVIRYIFITSATYHLTICEIEAMGYMAN